MAHSYAYWCKRRSRDHFRYTNKFSLCNMTPLWQNKNSNSFLEFPQSTLLTSIRIQWWGVSRSKKFEILVNETEVISYVEEQNPKLNGWTSFNDLELENVTAISIALSEGQEDCWGKNLHLGIRQIQFYGKYELENQKKCFYYKNSRQIYRSLKPFYWSNS